jgi:hypothetical protein
MSKRNQAIFRYVVYGLLAAGIVWQAAALVFSRGSFSSRNTNVVTVTGNVDRPGRYRIPVGTTQFEILRVAGIRPTSDILGFNLMQQVSGDDTLIVNTAQRPPVAKREAANARMEFYYGEMAVISRDGKNRPLQEGMTIDPGDRILTEAKSQAELSINGFSRLDIDNFSEISFEKIGVPEEDRMVVEIQQKIGICWYKTAYAAPNELYRILTPLVNITVGGSGADFMVEAKYEEINIHNMDGLLLVERPGGEEAINLISGQTVTIFSDGRPFQVKTLSPDVSPGDKFSQLMQEKTNYATKDLPLNFVYFGVPNAYYFVSVQYDKGITKVIDIPATTSIESYVVGINTLDQALLQGGGAFASTLVERIMDTRVSKYFLMDKSTVIRAAAAMGGVPIDVDRSAASYLKIAPGSQKLTDEKLIRFMSPGVSGQQECHDRQVKVLRALFDKLTTKNLVVTSVLATNLIAGVETNFSVNDIMMEYGKFMSNKSWEMRTFQLPTTVVKRGNSIIYEPNIEKCRNLMTVQ